MEVFEIKLVFERQVVVFDDPLPNLVIFDDISMYYYNVVSYQSFADVVYTIPAIYRAALYIRYRNCSIECTWFCSVYCSSSNQHSHFPLIHFIVKKREEYNVMIHSESEKQSEKQQDIRMLRCFVIRYTVHYYQDNICLEIAYICGSLRREATKILVPNISLHVAAICCFIWIMGDQTVV
jgi:hypothetical protein